MEIRLFREGNAIKMEMEDNGCGIDENVMPPGNSSGITRLIERELHFDDNIKKVKISTESQSTQTAHRNRQLRTSAICQINLASILFQSCPIVLRALKRVLARSHLLYVDIAAKSDSKSGNWRFFGNAVF